MKIFTYSKVGYSTSIYGCSNEYFNFIVIDDTSKQNIIGFNLAGMYGAESRIANLLKEKGYEEKYLPLHIYGKVLAKEGKRAYTEYTIINQIDELLNRGYIEFNKEYRQKDNLPPLKK